MINSFSTATLIVCCWYENQCMWVASNSILLEDCQRGRYLDSISNKNSIFILIPGCEPSSVCYDHARTQNHMKVSWHPSSTGPGAYMPASWQVPSRSPGGQTTTCLLTCLWKVWKETFLNVNPLFLVCEGLDTSLCFIKPEQVSWPLAKELKGKDWPSLQKINF